MIRAFIAIPLPEETRGALEDVQAALHVGRLTHPDTFHVTLAYLDKQKPETLERIHEVLSQIRTAPFEITITGTGVFGGSQDRAVWAGVDPNPELEELRERVRRAASRSDVSLPRERFRPHVTLARMKGRPKPSDQGKIQSFLASHGNLRLPPVVVDHFTLFQSTLHPSGAQHDPIVEYALS